MTDYFNQVIVSVHGPPVVNNNYLRQLPLTLFCSCSETEPSSINRTPTDHVSLNQVDQQLVLFGRHRPWACYCCAFSHATMHIGKDRRPSSVVWHSCV